MSVTADLPTPEPESEPRLDLDAIRARLSAAQGKTFWRSLEELAQTPDFQEAAQREFPRLGNALAGREKKSGSKAGEHDISRRTFLTVMGASLALAGLSGCGARPTQEKIVPYIDQPNGSEPGKALFYATALALGGTAQGVSGNESGRSAHQD